MSVVTLAQAKSFGTFLKDASDADLQATLSTAEAIAAHWVGPFSSTTVTERFFDVTTYMSLTSFPVISVTSITGSGNAPVDLTTVDIDLDSGTIYPDIYGWIHVFPLSRYTVVYQAGWASVPTDIQQGVLELVKVLWAPRRGSMRPSADSGAADTPPYLSSRADLPARVRMLWDPYIPLGLG